MIPTRSPGSRPRVCQNRREADASLVEQAVADFHVVELERDVAGVALRGVGEDGCKVH